MVLNEIVHEVDTITINCQLSTINSFKIIFAV